MFETLLGAKGWRLQFANRSGCSFVNASGDLAWYNEPNRIKASKSLIRDLVRGRIGAAAELEFVTDAERYRVLKAANKLPPELEKVADELLERAEYSI